MDMRILQFLNRMVKPQPNVEGSYNPVGATPPFVPTSNAPAIPQLPMNDIFRQAPESDPYAPSNVFGEQLNKQINNIPVRTPPSKMRNLGAIIAGMGSNNPIETVRNYQNFHHDNRMIDWKEKTNAIARGATDERADNTNKRLFRSQEEIERRNREAELDRDIKQQDQDKRTEIQRKRAETYAEVAKGGTLLMDKDGRTVIVYKDGTKRDVDVDQFSPAELEDLRQKGRLEAIRATGDERIEQIQESGKETRTTEGVRQTNRSALQEDRQIHDVTMQDDRQKATTDLNILKANSSSLGTGKPITELDKQRLATNNARQIRDNEPRWGAYLVFDDKNNFIRVDPQGTGGMKHLSPKEVKDLSDQVYGRGKNTSLVTTDTTKFDPKIEKSISDAVARGMNRDDVIAMLRKRGVIK